MSVWGAGVDEIDRLVRVSVCNFFWPMTKTVLEAKKLFPFLFIYVYAS